MASLNFPNNPAVGDSYTSGSASWRWDGVTWNLVPQMQPAVIGDTPPPSPVPGQFWWNSKLGQLYLWYDDGNTAQWVQAAGSALPYGGDIDMNQSSIYDVKQLAVGSTATTHADSIDTPIFSGGRVSTREGVYGNVYNTASGGKAIATGYTHSLLFNETDGTVSLYKSNASVAAGATPTWSLLMTIDSANAMTVPGNFATNALTATNGVVSRSIVSADGGIWAHVASAGTTFGFNRGSPFRYMQFLGNYYWDWHEGSGDLRWIQNGAVRTTWRTNDGAMIHGYSLTYKPGGGPWIDSSDSRIKEVKEPYALGLAEVAALNPVIYGYLGNDTSEPPAAIAMVDQEGDSHFARSVVVPYENSPHYQAALSGQTFVGLIAQEVEAIFPGMVTKREAFIDGEPVTDLRDLDTSSLIFALVNAVKELKTRVEELEARP